MKIPGAYMAANAARAPMYEGMWVPATASEPRYSTILKLGPGRACLDGYCEQEVLCGYLPWSYDILSQKGYDYRAAADYDCAGQIEGGESLGALN